jgi:hypothetical protein
MRKHGMPRSRATKYVAKKHGVWHQTVIDKYARQLNKRVFEIDQLLEPRRIEEFQALLEEKFARHKEVIRKFFKELGG